MYYLKNAKMCALSSQAHYIELDFLRLHRELKYLDFLIYKYETTGEITNYDNLTIIRDNKKIEELRNIFYNEEELKNCNRLNHNRYEKQTRIKKRITKIIENNNDPKYFITWTLKNTDYSIRYLREQITEMARKNFRSYIINVDFGKKTKRLHFHGFVDAKNLKEEEIKKLWKFGNVDIELFRYGNATRIAKYINKLTYHATKDTTKFNIIYSKDLIK